MLSLEVGHSNREHRAAQLGLCAGNCDRSGGLSFSVAFPPGKPEVHGVGLHIAHQNRLEYGILC